MAVTQLRPTLHGVSLKLWGPGSSCCLVYDRPADSVVDSLLAVLEDNMGLGQPPTGLLKVSQNKPVAYYMEFGTW